MIIQGIEVYYAAACLIQVCTSLICAVIRSFHMCRPFDENEHIYAGQYGYQLYKNGRRFVYIYCDLAIHYCKCKVLHANWYR